MVLTPEQRLWRAVLEQAYADAESLAAASAIEMENCVLAREFLRADTPDIAEILLLVCDFAEIPADRVIVWARRRFPAVV